MAKKSTPKHEETKIMTPIEKLKEDIKDALASDDMALFAQLSDELRELKSEEQLKEVKAAVKAAANQEELIEALKKGLEILSVEVKTASASAPKSKRTKEKKDTRPTAKAKDVPAILNYIKEHQGCKGKDIATALNLQSQSVSIKLGDLKKEGKISSEGTLTNMTYTAL